MIFLSVGLPGHFSKWCDNVVARLAKSLGGTVAICTWPSLEQMLVSAVNDSVLDKIALTLIGEGPSHLVVGARQPEERLRNAIIETKIPYIVALDDPRDAVADIAAASDVELSEATRAVANSCSALMRYIAAERALKVSAGQARADARETVLTIARHLSAPIRSVEADAIVRELDAAGLSLDRPGAEQTGDRIPEVERKLVDGTLGAYSQFFAGGNFGQIVWSRGLFRLVSDPAKGPSEPIDVSGSARCLLYGPYIHLAAGSWSARVVLGFSDAAVGRIFQFIGYMADRELASTSFQPESAGVYTAEISFSIDEPAGRGIDLRVLVLSNNASGHLAFGHVVVTPLTVGQPAAANQPQGSFDAVLGL